MYGYGYRYNSGLVLSAGGGAPFANTYSLSFDGIDDYLDVGNLSILNSVTSYSSSSWVKCSSFATGKRIWGRYVSGDFHYLTVQATSGNIAYSMTKSFPTAQIDTTNGISLNTWTNIITVYDGTLAAADRLKIYINGVLQSVTSINTAQTSTGANTGNMSVYIAAINGLTSPFTGNIDEVAFFDFALDSATALSIGGTNPTDLSLLATPPTNWYRNGDNGAYKSPQWLIPNNENFANKVSNYSFDFDGVDDYIGLGNPTDLQITGAFSFSCWVNTTSTNYEGIYFKGNSVAASDIYIRRQNNGTVRMFINNLAKNVTSSTTVNDGNWHHILCVFVPSTSMTIYIDGSQDAQNTTTIPSVINNNYGNISIGGGGGQFFNGKIDEASIFNNDQSANISTLYNGGEPTTISGAVAHYKMGEEATFSGGVWTVPDSAGSNNGTSNAMDIEDRVGEAPNSENNALSYNMDEVDRVTDVP